MRIVVLGDIHAYRLLVPPWRLLCKRFLGQMNLWLSRRHHFRLELMEAILERATALGPDLALLTGDLTTTSLEGEFEDVGRRLELMSGKVKTLAVPGNHDRYTFKSARVRRMEKLLPGVVPPHFPEFRRLSKRWRLLALDGAAPRLLNARGRLGKGQLSETRRHLKRLTADDGLVVVCHYPLKCPMRAPPTTYGHRLADARSLRRILQQCPARIVYVHGHTHQPWCWQPRRSDSAHITYLNAGAPCLTSTRYPLGQGFWELDLPEEPHDHVRVAHHLPDANGYVPRGIEKWQVRQVL